MIDTTVKSLEVRTQTISAEHHGVATSLVSGQLRTADIIAMSPGKGSPALPLPKPKIAELFNRRIL